MTEENSVAAAPDDQHQTPERRRKKKKSPLQQSGGEIVAGAKKYYGSKALFKAVRDDDVATLSWYLSESQDAIFEIDNNAAISRSAMRCCSVHPVKNIIIKLRVSPCTLSLLAQTYHCHCLYSHSSSGFHDGSSSRGDGDHH